MPGGASELDLRFNLIYPGLYTAFTTTEAKDGTGAIVRMSTDFVDMDVNERLYYQMLAVQGGRAKVDSNAEHDIVNFIIDFWFPLLFTQPREYKWFGGLFQPPGVLETKVEPLLNPYWWLNPASGQVNATDLFHGFVSEPEYTTTSELLGRVMHCQLGASLLVRGTV